MEAIKGIKVNPPRVIIIDLNKSLKETWEEIPPPKKRVAFPPDR